MKAILLVFALLLSACAHRMVIPNVVGGSTSSACSKLIAKAANENIDEQLNRVSDLYSLSCFKEVISLGSFLRTHYRTKFYQVSGEMAEILAPEGSFTSYVLESYERTYLSLLVAISYLNLEKEGAALVELRRARDEEASYLYNYGADPVLSMLQAALWDRFDPQIARPHWKFLSEVPQEDLSFHPAIMKFAKARIQEIDANPNAKVRWRVVGIGNFPELDWSTNFFNFKKNSYNISAKSEFPAVCANADEALLSTGSWVRKISQRYKSDYHPMLYMKSLVRFPVAVTYGVVGVGLGIGLGVGVCLLTAQGDSSGKSCEESMKMSGYIIGKTSDFVKYTVKPDLRHWSKLPSAFFISRLPYVIAAESCLAGSLTSMKTLYLIE